MSDRGVFAVARGVFDHPLFADEPFSEREAWLWLVISPTLRRRRVNARLASRWKWPEGRVRSFLERACNAGLVEINDEAIVGLEPDEWRPSSVRPGSSSWRALRQLVFQRDGFACVYCGSLDELACDHVHPRSRGGRNEPTNLVTACRTCNSSKRDRLLSEWRA